MVAGSLFQVWLLVPWFRYGCWFLVSASSFFQLWFLVPRFRYGCWFCGSGMVADYLVQVWLLFPCSGMVAGSFFQLVPCFSVMVADSLVQVWLLFLG